MLDYPDHITITRPAFSKRSADGGYDEGTPTTVYSGKCDAQESGRQFVVAGVEVSSRGDCTAYLPEVVDLSEIEPDDDATVAFQGGPTIEGRITRILRTDHAVEVSYR